MKNYLKSWSKSIYQKVQRVVQDEYLQPLTQIQIYSTINKKIKQKPNNKNSNQSLLKNVHQHQQLLANIDRISLITPQREFMLIGEAYTFQVINYRAKQLKAKNEAINRYLMNSYQKNLQTIQQAVLQITKINNLKSSKQKSQRLRSRLNVLQQQVQRTLKITKLNIKLKNIKNVLKIMQKVPNLSKMKLFQLKNINMQQINILKQSLQNMYPNSKQSALKCIQHLDFFIDKASSQHLRKLMDQISQCLTNKFQNLKYQKAVKDFIISKSSIQYQKLLTRLVETEVRDKIQQIEKNSQKNTFFQICKRYITILINMFKLFRWHRSNLASSDPHMQSQQKIRTRTQSMQSNCSQSSQSPVINLDTQQSIKINCSEIKIHICQLMDQCLKQQIEELLFNDTIKLEEIYQFLNLLNRFFKIAFSFSSYFFIQSTQQVKQILQRKCYKVQQRGIKDFNEMLAIQQGNQWNRLPVMRTFRHKSLQRNMLKIKRLIQIDKIQTLNINNFTFLNITNNSQYGSFLFESTFKHQQTFQLKLYKFPFDKIQKDFKFDQTQISLPTHEDAQVVLCQSSLTILNYFDQYYCMYIYFPIHQIRAFILDKMSFFVQYYIYYLFETFLSITFKNFFSQNYQTIEDKYLQIRMKKNYEKLSNFIQNFKQNKQKLTKRHNDQLSQTNHEDLDHQISNLKSNGYLFIKKDIKQSRIQLQNMVKARAMAAQSLKFILAYFQYILTNLSYSLSNKTSNKCDITSNGSEKSVIKQKKSQQNQVLQYKLLKITQYKQIQTQLSDILLTDSIPKTTKIDFVDPIMKKIKWQQSFQSRQTKQIYDYSSIILKNTKEVYDKMKSMSKGEIPFYIVDRIFAFYWRTQLTYMTKIFLNQHILAKQKGGKIAKLSFQKIIDFLYQGIVQFLDEKHKASSSSSISSNQSIKTNQSSEKRVNHLKITYLKIKNIFPILLETDWDNCKTAVQQSIKNHEFVYKISMSIMMASECCSGMSTTELEERQFEIDQFIINRLIKANLKSNLIQ